MGNCMTVGLTQFGTLSPGLVHFCNGREIMNDFVQRRIDTDLKHTAPRFLFLMEEQNLSALIGRQTEKEATTVDFSRIRCPLCKWQPKPAHRWFCASCSYPEFFDAGCGTCWNTFTTRGRCPGCNHQWRWTACLNCAQWSLHADWYETDSGKRNSKSQ
jgi:hypothetical protein